MLFETRSDFFHYVNKHFVYIELWNYSEIHIKILSEKESRQDYFSCSNSKVRSSILKGNIAIPKDVSLKYIKEKVNTSSFQLIKFVCSRNWWKNIATSVFFTILR